MLGSLCIGGFATGHLRIFDAEQGELQVVFVLLVASRCAYERHFQAEIAAHSRTINAIDVSVEDSAVVSTGEDGIVNVFAIPSHPNQQQVRGAIELRGS